METPLLILFFYNSAPELNEFAFQDLDMIYLDYSKAYDSVDQKILLQKRQAHGVSGSLLLWFKSYLTNLRI